MKKALYTFLIALFATATFGINGGDQIRIHVIHQVNGEVLVLDTVFDASSGYSVEQFLRDNGLDPEKTDIIHLDMLEGDHLSMTDRDVWYFSSNEAFFSPGEGENSFEFKTGDENDFQFEEVDVRVEKVMNEKGVEQTRYWVNGEEVDELPEGIHTGGAEQEINIVIVNDGDADTENIFQMKDENGGDSKDVRVEKKIVDGKETTNYWVNGEEVDELPEGLNIHEYNFGEDKSNGGKNEVIIIRETDEQGDSGKTVKKRKKGKNKSGEEQVFEVEIREEVDSEGNVVRQKWVNGEEVDPDFEIEHPEGAIIEMNIEMETDEGGEGQMMRTMSYGKMAHTLAIVSKVPSSEVKNMGTTSDKEIGIEDLSFYPNPSKGLFRVSFSLPNKGMAELRVMDTLGKLVYEENLGNFSGKYDREIDISKAGKGTYVLQVVQGNKTLAEKLIVR